MFGLDDLSHVLEIKTTLKKNQKMKPERIYLFLDFDGVINAGLDMQSFQYEMLPSGYYNLSNKACVERVNQLCLDYHLQVVLSTSWRSAGIPSCQAYMHDIGFDEVIPVVGATTLETIGSRENQIIEYLLEHNDYTGFLILDDIPMEHLEGYQVITDFLTGYDEDRDVRARAILSSFHQNL